MNKNIFLFFVAMLLLVTSCKTRDKTSELNYMQNVEQVATETALKTAGNTIQKGDQLVIFVSARNMEVVRPFNQGYYTSPDPTISNAPNSEKVYLVDSEGDIDFPVIGKLNTTDKTLETFRTELTDRVSRYVKNPTVTMRLANFKVTFLGEVARPGQISVPEGQTTLLNALGLVGDVTMYAKRDGILIVRNVNGTIEKARISLMDDNLINSPYFQLKQNDVIYVSSNEKKEKISRQDPNINIYIAVAGMVVGLAGIFITIFRN
ncbi:polysaccharide biosynthesis/export family protein [Kaistella sp. 97-N-M2]|uniref:polysaccharide biosynthesis/export family protein n=1 Tax=Kaistella sp. 97-N-M2 TaxID=2908645 RepID=UPI001F316105|nr:polysaccharide biosynthesis/export family protein [Kaistella sp. 97-N-M2]UJF28805.1 polysaccharide biosynthesis/export family protein [Kaistella sp. 97-N-M2]